MQKNVVIIICVTSMLALMFFRRKRFGIKNSKLLLAVPCVVYMGLLGTNIMFLIENGTWGGRSFFGAVLFFPILLLPVSLLVKVKLIDLLSLASPPGMLMLAIYKYCCSLEGCCGGRVMGYSESGVPIYFPSQIVEMGVAITISILLLILEQFKTNQRKIYPICLVIYGTTRYILNQFRWEQEVWILGMTAGNFWSAIAVLIGIIWLAVARKRINKAIGA